MANNQVNQVITLNEFKILFDKLYGIQNQAYKMGTEPEDTVSEYLNEEEKFYFDGFCENNGMKYKNPEDLQKAIRKYMEKLKNTDKILFTIAFEPSVKFLKMLCGQLENLIQTDLILEYKVDQTIIGGAVLEYKGKYYSYILRDIAEKVFGSGENNDNLETVDSGQTVRHSIRSLLI